MNTARAHVGADDLTNLIMQAAFERSREAASMTTGGTVDDDSMTKMATQALVQLGFPRPVATSAVNAARALVGANDLTSLIKEALQRTNS